MKTINSSGGGGGGEARLRFGRGMYVYLRTAGSKGGNLIPLHLHIIWTSR
jgi:hypothetical protein